MSEIQMIKQEYVVNINNLNFRISSFSTNIELEYMFTLALNKIFYTELYGVKPFELTVKGYFIADTDLILPTLYATVKNMTSFSLDIKNCRFKNLRLAGIKFSENIKDVITDCELKLLVLGGVEALE